MANNKQQINNISKDIPTNKIKAILNETEYYSSFVNLENDDILNDDKLDKHSSVQLFLSHYEKARVIANKVNCFLFSQYKFVIDFSFLNCPIDTKPTEQEVNDEVEHMIAYLVYSSSEDIDPIQIKKSGTEYTPEEIVSLMLDIVRYDDSISGKSVIEPSCGTGAFLHKIIDRFLLNTPQDDIVKLLVEEKKIVGFEINPISSFICRCVVVLTLIKNGIEKRHILQIFFDNFPIYERDFLKESLSNVDYVIGNPPYIRLHNLDSNYKSFLKNEFKSSTGRFDIYTCFMEKSLNILSQHGSAALIVSNKFMTTNYGVGVRKVLSENSKIHMICNLNDTKVFSTAVLPSIIVYGKDCVLDKPIKTTYINVNTSETDSAFEGSCNLEFNNFISNHLKEKKLGSFVERFCYLGEEKKLKIDISEVVISTADQWNFNSITFDNIIDRIVSNSSNTLGEICDIMVGIKTTADTVYVKPMTHTFIKNSNLESELIYPLIQSFNVEKWQINWSKNSQKDRYILYPHVEHNGKTVPADLNKFPNVCKYLCANEGILKSRTYLSNSLTRQWFECWVPQTLRKFGRKKIVTKDIVERNSFALDMEKRLCQGNTFFITIKNECASSSEEDKLLYFLLGILNSSVLEFYQNMTSGKLYSSKMRYTTSNLKRWPIRFVKDEFFDSIADITKSILLSDCNDRKKLENSLNSLVYKYYSLPQQDIDVIESILFK